MVKLSNSLFPIAIVVLAAVSGCATRNANWPWRDASSACPGTACVGGDALRAYVNANRFCREVHNYYESGGRRSGATQFFIGLTGALAGAVVSPLASGDAAKALSGLSGATNALQLSFEESFSTAVAANRTKAVLDATEKGAKDYKDATGEEAKVIAAINMATSCAMSQAKADNQTLKALASSGTP